MSIMDGSADKKSHQPVKIQGGTKTGSRNVGLLERIKHLDIGSAGKDGAERGKLLRFFNE
jgi:hypothetical protein